MVEAIQSQVPIEAEIVEEVPLGLARKARQHISSITSDLLGKHKLLDLWMIQPIFWALPFLRMAKINKSQWYFYIRD